VIGLNGLSIPQSSTAYSAQLASIHNSWFTELRLINASKEERTIHLTPIAEDGSELAKPKAITLMARGMLNSNVSDLFSFEQSSIVGSLKVESDGTGVLGDVVFGSPSDMSYAAALPLQTEAFRKAIFNQVAQHQTYGYFTGLALFNPGSIKAHITIQVFDSSGGLKGNYETDLEAGQRMSKMVSELLLNLTDQLGGYIVIDSTRPLIAQQLFGSSDLSFISAVPPTFLE